jgi:hypothetical protein
MGCVQSQSPPDEAKSSPRPKEKTIQIQDSTDDAVAGSVSLLDLSQSRGTSEKKRPIQRPKSIGDISRLEAKPMVTPPPPGGFFLSVLPALNEDEDFKEEFDSLPTRLDNSVRGGSKYKVAPGTL